MRRLLKIALWVLVVLVLAVASIPLWVDAVTHRKLEAAGTEALGVPTTIGSVHIGVFNGEARFEQLAVANPAGIEGNFLEIDRGETAVSYGSVFADRVEVDTVRITGVRLNLGMVGEQSNYQPILDHMRKTSEASSGPGEPTGSEEEDGETRYVIREIVLRDIHVTARVKVAGIFRPAAEMQMDELRFTNVTDENSGTAMSEVTRVVTQALLDSVVRQGGGILPGEVVDGLRDGMNGMGQLGVGIVTGTGKVLGAGARLVGDGIGALFGGGKRESDQPDSGGD